MTDPDAEFRFDSGVSELMPSYHRPNNYSGRPAKPDRHHTGFWAMMFTHVETTLSNRLRMWRVVR